MPETFSPLWHPCKCLRKSKGDDFLLLVFLEVPWERRGRRRRVNKKSENTLEAIAAKVWTLITLFKLCRSVLISLLFLDNINGRLLVRYSHYSHVNGRLIILLPWWYDFYYQYMRLRSDLELEVGGRL